MEWMVKDKCGYFCIFLTYVIIAVIEYVLVQFSLHEKFQIERVYMYLEGQILFQYLQPEKLIGYFHVVLFNIIGLLFIISHVKCITTNPGTLPNQTTLHQNKLPQKMQTAIDSLKKDLAQVPNSSPLIRSIDEKIEGKTVRFSSNLKEMKDFQLNPQYQALWEEGVHLAQILDKRCNKCESLQPPNCQHCSTCNACVAHVQHHCLWVNNCIGPRNQKFFLLFLMYAVLGLCYASYLFYYKIRKCSVYNMLCGFRELALTKNLMTLNVALVIFCFVQCVDTLILEVQSILTYRSIFDRKKKLTRRAMLENLERVFGGKFGLSWFVPVQGERKIIMEEEY